MGVDDPVWDHSSFSKNRDRLLAGEIAAKFGVQAPGFYRFRVGAFKVIALHDGVLVRDRPAQFVRNAGTVEIGDAFAACGMARDKLTLTFNPLAVETGDCVVLIDTGLGEAARPAAGHLPASLAAAGIRAEDVSSVVISHFHGDHIGGLRKRDGTPAFPKADVLVPEEEWDFWMGDRAVLPDALKGTAASAHRAFDPIAADVRRYAFGEEILPGFTAVDASEHTPGMAAIEIASGGGATLSVADITNNPLIFARHPDWQAMFDMDPECESAWKVDPCPFALNSLINFGNSNSWWGYDRRRS